MLAVLRQRNFALLWAAGLVSTVGTWALYTALPYYVYARTGSALATGTTFAVQMIPRVVLAPVAGVCADVWDRKRTMIATDVARALLLLPLFAVQSREWLWVIYAIAFWEATQSQFFDPARGAILPRLVDEESLLAANSMDALVGPLNRLLAPAMGGALLTLLGLTGLILTDVASYLLSAALIVLICAPPSVSGSPAVALRPGARLAEAAWRD